MKKLSHSNRIRKLPKELLLDIITDLSDALSRSSSTSGFNSNHLTISSNLSNVSTLNFNSSNISSPTTVPNLQLTYYQTLNSNYSNEDSLSQK